MKCFCEDIKQCLLDAGCNEKEICIFFKTKCNKEKLRILETYRSSLILSLREKQKQIDCIDYLMYQLEREEV